VAVGQKSNGSVRLSWERFYFGGMSEEMTYRFEYKEGKRIFLNYSRVHEPYTNGFVTIAENITDKQFKAFRKYCEVIHGEDIQKYKVSNEQMQQMYKLFQNFHTELHHIPNWETFKKLSYQLDLVDVDSKTAYYGITEDSAKDIELEEGQEINLIVTVSEGNIEGFIIPRIDFQDMDIVSITVEYVLSGEVKETHQYVNVNQ